MPFKSEKQRRYLWANEPEIARDWTDTYGSRIQANLGGIMRLALAFGGTGGSTGSRGGHGGGGGWGGPGGKSPGTTSTGGFRGDDDGKARHIQDQIKAQISMLGAPPGRSTSTGHTPTPKGFLGRVGTGIKNYITSGGLIGMGIRGIKDVFGKFGTGWDSSMGPREDMGYNPTQNNPFSGPNRGDRPYIPSLYNWDDLYAQNVMEEDGLDIDTSTGNMQDWSQRFRVDNPYRQDQGTLDPQIRDYISQLYT